MKAMILAAGLGSRLLPLTERLPKALVEVGGEPLIARVLRRLVEAGVSEVIVNAFHLADQLEAFLRGRDFGVPVALSREETLLDTGGGLKHAAWFFRDGEPFLIHNVDVLSEIDLKALLRRHAGSGALATLAAHERESGRYLLFDAQGRLRGREDVSKRSVEWAGEPAGPVRRLAFAGIHAVSPAIFEKMTETGAFPIVPVYLRLAAAGERIEAFRADGASWRDVGDAGKLSEARRELGP